MDPVAPSVPASRRILDLARRDRAAAEAAVATLSLDQQVELLCEAPLAARFRVLGLLPEPEHVIPALPPAELCFTVKAVGLADAGVLLEYASPEQIVAALDLDAWRGTELDAASASEWLCALAACTTETRVRAIESIDMELTTLALRTRIGVVQKPDESEGWSPPPGSQTLEGMFHFFALSEDDDIADVRALLDPLFDGGYWTYFRLMQALIWELESETSEWALRWRSGRLEDLGFPPWDDAMRIYRTLSPERRDALPAEREPTLEEWALPVWMPQLPSLSGEGERLFRAIAALDDVERRTAFFAFVALANRVAVADRMPLGDADSTPTAIAKAARIASAGLDHLVRRHGVDDVSLLRRASIEHLFRVGANLDPASARARDTDGPAGSAGGSVANPS